MTGFLQQTSDTIFALEKDKLLGDHVFAGSVDTA